MKRSAYDVMDLKSLRCFYIMAQHESVSQASIELGISEAAVSQRIKSLECYLNLKLYESRGGHVRLTIAGDRAFAFAMSVFDEIDAFEYTLEKSAELGEITLSAPDSVLRHLLPAKVKTFLQSYPRTRLCLFSRPVEETLQLVRSNEFDLGVISKRRLPKELRFQAIETHPSCLILPKGHSLASQAKKDFHSVLNKEILTGYPLIVLDTKQEGLRVNEALAHLDFPINVSLEVGTIDSLKYYVALGVGIAIISALSLTPEDEASMEVIPVPTSLDPGTTYGIVTRRDKRENELLARFMELLLA